MRCKVCGINVQSKLCDQCKDFLKWLYPEEEPEEIIQKYKELTEAHSFLRRKKRK